MQGVQGPCALAVPLVHCLVAQGYNASSGGSTSIGHHTGLNPQGTAIPSVW